MKRERRRRKLQILARVQNFHVELGKLPGEDGEGGREGGGTHARLKRDISFPSPVSKNNAHGAGGQMDRQQSAAGANLADLHVFGKAPVRQLPLGSFQI